MASSWKAMSRFSSRLQSLTLKLNKTSLSAFQSTSHYSSTRISRVSRLPLELSSVGSMMPLHSAIASARLVSSLASESQTWSLVPQDASIPFDKCDEDGYITISCYFGENLKVRILE